MRIGYGVNRHEREFDGLGIETGMIAIDNKDTLETERKVLRNWIREYKRRGIKEITVVILDKGDLGIGQGAAKFRKEIIDDGATIEDPTDRPSTPKKRGRPAKPLLTEEQEQRVCALWNGGGFKEKTVIARVKQEYGIELDRDQLNYICKRRPKRRAEAAKRKAAKEAAKKSK